MQTITSKRKKKTKKYPKHWQIMRKNHLLLYPECRICEDENDIHVHHLRYRGKRGVDEQPGDLVTLCSFHHNQFHKIYGMAHSHKGSLLKNTLLYISDQRAENDSDEEINGRAASLSINGSYASKNT